MIEKIKQKLKRYWRWFLITICGVGIVFAAPTLPDTVQEAFNKSDLKDRYEFVTDKLITKTEHIDDIKIAVSTLTPEMTLSKWDGEVDIKIKPKGAKKQKPKFEGEKIKFKESKKEHHFYDVENGYEIETILLEKPNSNVIEYEIETKGLDFFYQPELTQEEIDEGSFRPENVIGSYAVYHESKQGDYSKMDGKNYRAGKAFHIYRPKIIDANGAEVWGNLVLDVGKKVLTVEIPQSFLDNAVYPVVVDPTFGYTTMGSTESNRNYNWINAIEFSSGSADTVVSMSAYIKFNSSNSAVKYAIYNSSLNKITNGQTEETTISSGWDDWKTLNFSTAPSVTITNFWLCYWLGSNAQYFYYDTGTADQQFVENVPYISNYPNSINKDYEYSRKYSIYATYTAGGAEEEPPVQDVIWFD